MSNFIFPLYFDYSATTPLEPRILEKILPYFYCKFGNPSSRNHIFGWQAEYIIENSRIKISNFLNCDSREIIFTSGATESNNIAIKGLTFFYKNKFSKILSLNIEHKSIINSFNYLLNYGYNVIYLNVKFNGLLDLNLLNLFSKNTLLLSVMYVNNEIGVIQNINYLSLFCKKNKIIFHIDAVQSLGKININLNLINIDILSISCHKIYGPKGIGALYIRRKSNLYFIPLFHGGGQEKKIRSGTLSTSLIIGMCEIFSNLFKEMYFDNLKIRNYKNIFLIELLKIDSIYINGDIKYRIPHNLNISFNFIEGESLIISLKNIALSTGSACASNSLEPSYVIKNLNKSYNIIHSSLRFTFGRFNILSDFYYLLKLLFINIINLRKLSPLYVL
ncbi:Cysteine desulfurase [Candidatus Nasuia deltocephalinicola]|nr:Cysteine desulfurase [Candidatus Nasuia deltocephalinicola]